MRERYGLGGYVIWPGDRSYGCCGGDVDRFELWKEYHECQQSKEPKHGSNPDSDTSPAADSPT